MKENNLEKDRAWIEINLENLKIIFKKLEK